jgi:Ca2+-binding EF-hand superfamily protein
MNDPGAKDSEEEELIENESEKDFEQRMREAFDLFDQDESGNITVSELGPLLKSCDDKLTDDDIKEILKDTDKDENGQINFAG